MHHRLARPASALTLGVAMLTVLVSCSATDAPTPRSTKQGGAAKSAQRAATIDVADVDVCGWADKGLMAESGDGAILTVEGVGPTDGPERYVVEFSRRRNTTETDARTTSTECDLTYDGGKIALQVSLVHDPDWDLSHWSEGRKTAYGFTEQELSGMHAALTDDEPLMIEVDQDTHLSIEVYDAVPDSTFRAENIRNVVLPLGMAMAADWKAGEAPSMQDRAPSAPAVNAADWAEPNTICNAVDRTAAAAALGVDESDLAVTATSGTDSGTSGPTSDSVYCKFGNGTDATRIEATLLRYPTVDDGAQAFSSWSGAGASCPGDEVTVMTTCDADHLELATHSGRLVPSVRIWNAAGAGSPDAALAFAKQTLVDLSAFTS